MATISGFAVIALGLCVKCASGKTNTEKLERGKKEYKNVIVDASQTSDRTAKFVVRDVNTGKKHVFSYHNDWNYTGRNLRIGDTVSVHAYPSLYNSRAMLNSRTSCLSFNQDTVRVRQMREKSAKYKTHFDKQR